MTRAALVQARLVLAVARSHFFRRERAVDGDVFAGVHQDRLEVWRGQLGVQLDGVVRVDGLPEHGPCAVTVLGGGVLDHALEHVVAGHVGGRAAAALARVDRSPCLFLGLIEVE
jgi:hypothetical protein